jgi:hypothetical protein
MDCGASAPPLRSLAGNHPHVTTESSRTNAILSLRFDFDLSTVNLFSLNLNHSSIHPAQAYNRNSTVA